MIQARLKGIYIMPKSGLLAMLNPSLILQPCKCNGIGVFCEDHENKPILLMVILFYLHWYATKSSIFFQLPSLCYLKNKTKGLTLKLDVRNCTQAKLRYTAIKLSTFFKKIAVNDDYDAVTA